MTQTVDHVLLTRFNLPSAGAESLVRAKEGWLRSRLDLFEHYCLPSVQHQSNQSFKWIIYFDPQSPDWLVKRISALSNEIPFTPIYRTSVSNRELVADLHTVTGAERSHLITTNLDNDDGLAVDFIARLQEADGVARRTAVYLAHGLIRCGNRLYLRTDRTNAFCSVREAWDSPRTCWADWHNMLPQSMASMELEGSPAWLQVVHGTNVSNRIRGQRVGALPYLHLFGHLLDGADDPGHLELVRDVAIDRPIRIARESGRALLKQAALRTIGREGLDQIKSSLASRTANRG